MNELSESARTLYIIGCAHGLLAKLALVRAGEESGLTVARRKCSLNLEEAEVKEALSSLVCAVNLRFGGYESLLDGNGQLKGDEK